jgi:hypothetical protein
MHRGRGGRADMATDANDVGCGGRACTLDGPIAGLYHSRCVWELHDGTPVEVDNVLIEPEACPEDVEVVRTMLGTVLGGAWKRSSLGPFALLVRVHVVGEPAARDLGQVDRPE